MPSSCLVHWSCSPVLLWSLTSPSPPIHLPFISHFLNNVAARKCGNWHCVAKPYHDDVAGGLRRPSQAALNQLLPGKRQLRRKNILENSRRPAGFCLVFICEPWFFGSGCYHGSRLQGVPNVGYMISNCIVNFVKSKKFGDRTGQSVSHCKVLASFMQMWTNLGQMNRWNWETIIVSMFDFMP